MQATKAELGVDWLTLTYKRPSEIADLWYTRCGDYMAVHVCDEVTVKRETLRGYHGFRRGAVFVGMRDDGYILNVSGGTATEAYRQLYTLSARCTRIDAQVTVWYDSQDTIDAIGPKMYREADAYNETLHEDIRRRIDYHTGRNSGYTLYIGAPSSSQRGRAYDKGAQANGGDYLNAYRYEVQLREEQASIFAAKAHANGEALNRTLAIAVVSWYRERGVTLPGLSQIGASIPLSVRRSRTNTGRRLKWLGGQVAVVVAKLRAEGVKRETILHALGLDGGDDDSPLYPDDRDTDY